MKKRPFINADDLLKELVTHNDHLGEYVEGLYSPRDEVDGTYLNALFGQLRDQDLISCLYADNIAYFVTINPQGFAHAQQLDKFNWRKAKSMFDPLLEPYRGDFLEILKQYPEDSVIPYGTELDLTIKALRTRGYLSNFDEFVSGWGVSYSYEDKHYLDLEESYNHLREKTSMNINFNGGNNQFNQASDNATIHATQSIGVDASKLAELINALNENSKDLPPEDKQSLDESLDFIQTELTSSKPRKNLINFATKALLTIKGSVEFLAAAATLVQFVQTVISTLG